jgi:proteasome lid subunit RPN8/RPN11
MRSNDTRRDWHPHRKPRLTFAALAWVKLQFFCHQGNTEIAGFGISAENNPLYIEDFVTVRQHASMMMVRMDDHAIADFTDRCVDAGLTPQRFLRIWCHTHPGASPLPSGTDEETFARVFGDCDWAVMFIISRAASTYARLSFHAGPGMEVEMPVKVDWSKWPAVLNDPEIPLASRLAQWQKEFADNILPFPPLLSTPMPFIGDLPEMRSVWERFAETPDWTERDQELLEDYERHELYFPDNRQP